MDPDDRRASLRAIASASQRLNGLLDNLLALSGLRSLTHGISSEPVRLSAAVRDAAAQAGIHAYLPEPQASLAAGVLLGGTGGLDPDVRLQLQRSGLAHVVAICCLPDPARSSA